MKYFIILLIIIPITFCSEKVITAVPGQLIKLEYTHNRINCIDGITWHLIDYDASIVTIFAASMENDTLHYEPLHYKIKNVKTNKCHNIFYILYMTEYDEMIYSCVVNSNIMTWTVYCPKCKYVNYNDSTPPFSDVIGEMGISKILIHKYNKPCVSGTWYHLSKNNISSLIAIKNISLYSKFYDVNEFEKNNVCYNTLTIKKIKKNTIGIYKHLLNNTSGHFTVTLKCSNCDTVYYCDKDNGLIIYYTCMIGKLINSLFI